MLKRLSHNVVVGDVIGETSFWLRDAAWGAWVFALLVQAQNDFGLKKKGDLQKDDTKKRRTWSLC